MNDLVTRLRAGAGGGSHWMELHTEAADHIADLKKILEQTEECYVKLITTEIDATNRYKELEAQLADIKLGYDPMWAEKRQMSRANETAALEENKGLITAIRKLEAQLAAAHTLIHQIEDEIKFTGSEIHVRKSINNYRAALNGEDDG